MAKTREELAAIEALDNARRGANADKLIALATRYYNQPDGYHVSRGITGEPSSKNRTYRVTADNWTLHHYHDAAGTLKAAPTRCVGTDVTVIYADGTIEQCKPSSFRKQRNHASKQRKHAVAMNEVAERNAAARERLQATLQAHPIGNVE